MTVAPGSRRRQVLAALHEHGPLSLRTLERILKPEMTIRRLQETTKRLRDKGLIVRQFEDSSKNSEFYYQLGDSLAAKRKIAEWLKLDDGELQHPCVRGKEVRHTEQCAVWAEFLKLLYPEAKVVRDLKLRRELKRQDGYTPDRFDLDLVPDILLEFPKSSDSEKLLFAVEIERTQKSRVRLMAKLRKLATRTQFDGVLFVSESEQVLANVKRVYLGAELRKTKRIGHYSQAFCLFFLGGIDSVPDFPCHSAEGKEVPFRFWIDSMKATPVNSRREYQLLYPASVRWKMDDEF